VAAQVPSAGTITPKVELGSQLEGAIMPMGHVRAGFAINVGYFFLAAAVLVFIAMLALTLYT
jgi:hypothetical protein